MLGNENLWDAAIRCHQAFAKAGIAHAVCGGVAVCLHGYRRNTIDIDLIVRREDTDAIRENLAALGWDWNDGEKEFRTTGGIAIQFLLSGDRAGRGSEVRLPDPAAADVCEVIEGLPTLRLAKLIETKLACGEGDVRRTYRDFADVVELIAINNLDGSFTRFLHRSLRKTFRELVRRAQGEA